MALSYVLITPARNEERTIELTLKSVVEQTVLPMRWVIVDDGSTDRTGEIIDRYAREYDWIQALHRPEHTTRQFASKVHSFNAGYETVKDLPYDIVGNLDADISFEPDFFEFLLERFAAMPRLGVGGTRLIEPGFDSARDSYEGDEFVTGSVQLFRRECFEEIGGYIPSPGGGIDWIAVTTARMRGWTTKAFSEKYHMHHRSSGTGESNLFGALVKQGRRDHLQGNHLLWEAFRCVYKMTRKPYLIRGPVIATAYVWSWVSGVKRPISDELVAFHRREEMEKLRGIIVSILTGRRTRPPVAPVSRNVEASSKKTA